MTTQEDGYLGFWKSVFFWHHIFPPAGQTAHTQEALCWNCASARLCKDCAKWLDPSCRIGQITLSFEGMWFWGKNHPKTWRPSNGQKIHSTHMDFHAHLCLGGGMKGGVFVSSCHPRGASIFGASVPSQKRHQFQGAALSAKEAKLRQLLLQGLQSGHSLGVVGGVTDVFWGETSEIFKQGKGAEARLTVCNVEKKTNLSIFFLLSPALPLRCVPGKGAQKGPTISMKSLVNHIAQHKCLSTLSTYGCEHFHRLCLGSLPCPRRSWKMVTWKEYPERWARPRSQAKVGSLDVFFFLGEN